MGHHDAAGYIWFDGRKKEIIVRGGYNISPQEVKEAMCGHPAVLEVGVVGQPVPVHGERVVAFVALRDGVVANKQELRDHAAKRLTDLKVPEKIVFLPSLPKGVTGKIQRRALKSLLSDFRGIAHFSGLLSYRQVSKAGGRILWSFVSPHALASCVGRDLEAVPA